MNDEPRDLTVQAWYWTFTDRKIAIVGTFINTNIYRVLTWFALSRPMRRRRLFPCFDSLHGFNTWTYPPQLSLNTASRSFWWLLDNWSCKWSCVTEKKIKEKRSTATFWLEIKSWPEKITEFLDRWLIFRSDVLYKGLIQRAPLKDNQIWALCLHLHSFATPCIGYCNSLKILTETYSSCSFVRLENIPAGRCVRLLDEIVLKTKIVILLVITKV